MENKELRNKIVELQYLMNEKLLDFYSKATVLNDKLKDYKESSEYQNKIREHYENIVFRIKVEKEKSLKEELDNYTIDSLDIDLTTEGILIEVMIIVNKERMGYSIEFEDYEEVSDFINLNMKEFVNKYNESFKFIKSFNMNNKLYNTIEYLHKNGKDTVRQIIES